MRFNIVGVKIEQNTGIPTFYAEVSRQGEVRRTFAQLSVGISENDDFKAAEFTSAGTKKRRPNILLDLEEGIDYYKLPSEL